MKNSTDIWFIAYLQLRGEKIIKYDVLNRGRVRCYFELNDEQWIKYKLEFNNSEYIKFKSLIEQIKDLGF